jgi:hypothetical protein
VISSATEGKIMRRATAGLLTIFLMILSVSCTYHRAHINHSDFTAQMPISESAWAGENLGPVAANEAGAIWNDCTKSAKGTLWILIDETKRMGGNAIGDIRWIPKKEKKGRLTLPTCRKGWAWFLLWPAVASPVFMSSRAEGVAYKVDESELPRVGLYLIPETDEGQSKLVERILAESYSAASPEDAAPSATESENRSSCFP